MPEPIPGIVPDEISNAIVEKPAERQAGMFGFESKLKTMYGEYKPWRQGLQFWGSVRAAEIDGYETNDCPELVNLYTDQELIDLVFARPIEKHLQRYPELAKDYTLVDIGGGRRSTNAQNNSATGPRRVGPESYEGD